MSEQEQKKSNRPNRIENPETLEALRNLLRKWPASYYNTYAIVVRTDEGVEEIHERVNRPCYGEMRNYREKSKNRPDDRFPSDLKNNFPDGTPIGMALYIGNKPVGHYPLIEALFSPQSPWLGNNEEFLTNHEFVYKEEEGKKKLVGVIVKSGDIPPTPLVACMMMSRSFVRQPDVYKVLKEHKVPDYYALPLSICSGIYNKITNTLSFNSYNGVTHQYMNLFRVRDKNPIDLDGGLLWSDRCDYNRPEIMMAFVEDGNKNPLHCIPYTVKDFINKFKLLE